MSISNHKQNFICSVHAWAYIFSLLLFIPVLAEDANTEEESLDEDVKILLDSVPEGDELMDSKYPSPDDSILFDIRPEEFKHVQPEYPKEAQEKFLTGVVIVQALIDKKGNVVKAEVAKPSRHEMFDNAALVAAYKCKYKPAMHEGKPVALWISYKVVFKL